MNRKGSLITGVVLAVLGMGLTAAVPGVGVGTASAQDQAHQTLADPFFRVDYTAEPDGHGTTRITGYVYNNHGRAADQVRLRIIELDASGVTLALATILTLIVARERRAVLRGSMRLDR